MGSLITYEECYACQKSRPFRTQRQLWAQLPRQHHLHWGGKKGFGDDNFWVESKIRHHFRDWCHFFVPFLI